jgi:uncharacterized protein YkwD
MNYTQTIVLAAALAATTAPGAETGTFIELIQGYGSASRDRDAFHIVDTQPQLARDLADWHHTGEEILKLTNAARAQPRSCGKRHFRAVPPLRWNEKLAAAALMHTRDMAARNYFSHTGKDGRTVGDRASREGYSWWHIGENIATGQGSPAEIVATWLKSPEHCTNIMFPAFTEMGAAYVVNPKSDTLVYSTQVFGATRR